jgi:tetratricopeptide (TPR) repeat protein
MSKIKIKMKHLFFALLSTFFIGSVSAQVLDEELGFIYVKAEYLFETSRYEEAVTQYNQVITKDPKYKNALLRRGWCKYYLAGYKSAKMDAIQSIDIKGIEPASAALLGRSSAMLNDNDGAINSLSAAIALDNEEASYYEWRAEAYERDDEKLKACKDYESAMNLGSKAAEAKANGLCGISKHTSGHPKKNTDTPTSPNTNPIPNTSNHGNTTNDNDIKEDEVLSDGTREDQPNTGNTGNTSTPNTGGIRDSVTIVDDSDPVVVDETIPKDDNTVNSFVIDEDLTIEISGQELGRRKISETPSILILADETGTVTIHICVNKAGEVTKAEFNPTMSTIAKKSLVSLAIRKAKEFTFSAGKYDIQCGVMVFKIKGS